MGSYSFEGEAANTALVRDSFGIEVIRQAGPGQGWNIPVAALRAPDGFDVPYAASMRSEHTLCFRTSGALPEGRLGKKRFQHPANHGAVSLQPRGGSERWVVQGEVSFIHLYMRDELIRDVAASTRGEISIAADLLRDDRLAHVDDALKDQAEAYVRRAFSSDDPPSALEMDARADLIVIHLLKDYSRLPAPARPPVRGGLAPWQQSRVEEYMHAHLDEDIPLARLAALVDLSAYHFCRAFKVSTGLPPHQWLTARRIERAKMLMRETRLSLIEIALEVGYGSQGSFGTAFRKLAGAAPAEWRRLFASGRTDQLGIGQPSERRHSEGDSPVPRRKAAAIALGEE